MSLLGRGSTGLRLTMAGVAFDDRLDPLCESTERSDDLVCVLRFVRDVQPGDGVFDAMFVRQCCQGRRPRSRSYGEEDAAAVFVAVTRPRWGLNHQGPCHVEAPWGPRGDRSNES